MKDILWNLPIPDKKEYMKRYQLFYVYETMILAIELNASTLEAAKAKAPLYISDLWNYNGFNIIKESPST